MQLCLQLLLVFVSYSTLALRSLCLTKTLQSFNTSESLYYSFKKISNLYSIHSTLSTRMIHTLKISTTMLSNLATSSITTYRRPCGAWLPLRCSQASSGRGMLHPPTRACHKLLKKLDQNRTAYTVQWKPFIRFPNLPNSRSLRSAPTYSMDYYGEIRTTERRTKYATIKFTK